MKTYCINEVTHTPMINTVQEYTEDDIINEYWDFWYTDMVKKFGKEHELITEQNCIDDWVTIHWAWEKKDETVM